MILIYFEEDMNSIVTRKEFLIFKIADEHHYISNEEITE